MMRNNFATKFAGMALVVIVAVSGCKKSTSDPVVPPPVVVDPLKTSYTLKAKDVLGITGTVTFAEVTSGSTNSVVTIKLTGAPSGVHPAHIHTNAAIETGGIAFSLSDVDASGNSSTILAVSYATLIAFDGYVNVHLDALTLGTIIAQGDIGGNALSGISKTYALVQDSATGVSGSARFDKRKNGTTLVTVDLTPGGVVPLGMYPAHINIGSVATIGTPDNKKTLNPVDGATRMGVTNVRTLNDGTPITYDNWVVYDGFMTIHDAADSTNVIAKGNIGAN